MCENGTARTYHAARAGSVARVGVGTGLRSVGRTGRLSRDPFDGSLTRCAHSEDATLERQEPRPGRFLSAGRVSAAVSVERAGSVALTPLVFLVHRDPLVHELIGGTLGDEFTFVNVRTAELALKRAARQTPAVIVIDCGADDPAPEALVHELRALDVHVRAIFLADSVEAARAWRLSDLGMILPKRQDLDRLRHAIRSAARLYAMTAGVERLRHDTGVPDARGVTPRHDTAARGLRATTGPEDDTTGASSRRGAALPGRRGES